MKVFLFLLPFAVAIILCSASYKNDDPFHEEKPLPIEEAQKIASDSIQTELNRLTEINEKISTNKKLVAAFYQELFGDKDLGAIDRYIGDVYIQHNPNLSDGKEALREALQGWFANAPKEKIDIQRIGGDGDLVYLHTRAPGDPVRSILDIFRLEDGRIVEHWDIIQEVPKNSANPHPMF